VVLAAATSAIYWAARPYLVTFLLVAVYLWVLESYRWRYETDLTLQHRLWVLPVLMVIWANSHGGFIVGFILVGIYALDALIHWLITWVSARFDLRFLNQITDTNTVPQAEIDKTKSSFIQLFLTAVFMLLAVCLNPSGPIMLLYPFKTVSIGALSQYIQEWQPPNFHSAQVLPFVLLILVTFGMVGASRRRLALTDFLLFAGFAYLSFNASRNIALFALAAAPVLARHADSLFEEQSLRFRFELNNDMPSKAISRLNWGIFILLGLAVAAKSAQACSLETNQAAIAATMPVKAVNYIEATQPTGRLFNSYNWGGYLLFQLQDYPVFIDGRTDLYDDQLVNEWLQIVQAREGWREALDQWNVNLVLVEPGVPLVSQLAREDWKLIYEDKISMVFER
jgi:hypothetical protein